MVKFEKFGFSVLDSLHSALRKLFSCGTGLFRFLLAKDQLHIFLTLRLSHTNKLIFYTEMWMILALWTGSVIKSIINQW